MKKYQIKFIVGLAGCLLGTMWVKAATEAELEKATTKLNAVEAEYHKIFPYQSSLEKTGAFTQIYQCFGQNRIASA